MKRYSNLQCYVSKFENLEVHIFVIGYKNLGESCIILYVDTGNSNKVVFSMVVDSYLQNNINLAKDILLKYKVDKLNIVCWTHPHHDHSLGIDDLVKDFYSDNLVFIRPDFYYGDKNNGLLKNECNKTIDIFSNILGCVSKKNLWPIKSSGGTGNCYQIDLISENDNKIKNSDMFFLTPNISTLDWKAIYNESLTSPNELSVSFVLSLDDYMFYFGGDTENPNIKCCNQQLLKDIRWVKVPHHCSKTSNALVYSLGDNLDYAVSTVFLKHNLPDKEIQDLYANKTILYMTQMAKEDKGKYGIVEFTYKFNIDGTTVDVTTYGNAYKYDEA